VAAGLHASAAQVRRQESGSALVGRSLSAASGRGLMTGIRAGGVLRGAAAAVAAGDFLPPLATKDSISMTDLKELNG